MEVFKRKPKEVDNNAITPFWNVVLNIVIGIFAFTCVFPFLFVIAISFTDEKVLALNGFSLIPEKFSMAAYQFIFNTGDQLFRSFGVTLLVTVLGTLISLFLITTYAYVLSRRSFRYRNFFQLLRLLHDVILRRNGSKLYCGHTVFTFVQHDMGFNIANSDECLFHPSDADLLPDFSA